MMLLVVMARRSSGVPTSSGMNAIRAGLSRQVITPDTAALRKAIQMAMTWVSTAAPIASDVTPSTVDVSISMCRLSWRSTIRPAYGVPISTGTYRVAATNPSTIDECVTCHTSSPSAMVWVQLPIRLTDCPATNRR